MPSLPSSTSLQPNSQAQVMADLDGLDAQNRLDGRRALDRFKVGIAVCRIFLAVLVSMFIWEAILRVFVSSPIPFHHDPVLGWMPKPHSSGLCAWEGAAYSHYNERGFRDDPIEPRRDGELRIACLGDSYTEATQIEIEETFSRVLQQQLRNGGLPTRVFNAGRSGTALPQVIGLSKAYQNILEPDWVVVTIRDAWDEAFNRDHEFHLVPDGEGFDIAHSWHWESMSASKRLLIQWHIRDIALFQFGIRHFAELRRARVQDGSASEVDPDGLERHLRAIDWTIVRLKESYPKLVVVHVPYGSAALGALLPASPMEKRVVEACQRAGIACIPMRPVIENEFARSRRPPFGFANTLPWGGHPNAHGHGLIARELAVFFRERMVPSPH